MSERLIVRFEHKGVPVAAAYWRWGAYTRSAAYFADELMWSVETHAKITPRTGIDRASYSVVRVLLGMGGSFQDWDEDRVRYEKLEQRFRKGVCNDVYVFELCDWTDMECWSERRTIEGFNDDANGVVAIDLDRKTIRFDSWCHWSREEFLESDGAGKRHEKLLADFDPTEVMSWEEFRKKLLPILNNKEAMEVGHFKSADGKQVYVAIE